MIITLSNEMGDVAVCRDFSRRYLLHGTVYRIEKSGRLLGLRHDGLRA